MAGYSGTPLLKKLGITKEHRVLLRKAPPALSKELRGYAKTKYKDRLDVCILFARSFAEFNVEFEAYRRSINADGMIWVAWPKKASGLQADLTEDLIRETALKTIFVDVKVCAIDEIWSGLKLVIRKEHREKFTPTTE